MKTHLKTHRVNGKICDECGKEFTRPHHSKIHMMAKHESGEKSWCCDSCKYSYTTKRALQRHLEKVHGIKRKLKSSKRMQK